MTTITPIRPVVQSGSSELATLLTQCAEGDEPSFRTLYFKTSPQLFGVLRRMLKTELIAEQALHETYLKIWNNSHRYDESLGAPLTWMTSIARYHALEILRRSKKQEGQESNLSGEEKSYYHPNQPLIKDTLATEEIFVICLNELDEQAKSCILKAYCEGCTHDELSRIKNTPIGIVKTWIRQSLLALRECIDDLS